MTENDRYTDPKDAGWHAAQAMILIGIYALVIWAGVRAIT